MQWTSPSVEVWDCFLGRAAMSPVLFARVSPAACDTASTCVVVLTAAILAVASLASGPAPS